MKKRFKEEYGFNEYFINDTHLKKLYNMYIHKSLFDKLIDILMLFAMITIIVGFVLEYLIRISPQILALIDSLSLFILAIFMLELFRKYLRSNDSDEFFRKYWIDIFLVVFLSFYFVFITFLGFAKFIFLDLIKFIVSETKKIRIFYEQFKK